MDLAATHGLALWDSLILSVAAEQRCRLLLAEGLHHGFTWRVTTMVNGFARPDPELIDVLVNSHRR